MELVNELIVRKDSEEVLIKKWKRKHDDNIALYFFNKYKDEVLNIIYKKINLKFSSVPIEKNDLFYLVWKSILYCLKSYDFNKNKNFKAIVINRAYQLSIREAIKFLNNNQLVMNNAYSYDHLFEKNKNFNLGKNGKNEINYSYSDVTKNFIEDVISFNKRYDINLLKRVIYLRSLGFSVKEISKNVKVGTRYINTMIHFICRIAKKLF